MHPGLNLAFLAAALGLLAVHLFSRAARRWVWLAMLAMGLLLVTSGAYLGLVWSPPEKFMGDVYRIIYAHVPLLWAAMISLAINSIGSIVYLMKRSWVTDSLNEAAAETGVVFGAAGVALGSIWAKPTWGVWWNWDPRLTTAAFMIISGAGYLVLRRFIEDAERRATWASVVGIFSGVNLVLVYFSVKLWRSLHQVQSTSKTLEPEISFTLYWNAIGFSCLLFVFLWLRYRIASLDREREVALPEPPPMGGRP